VRTNRRVQTEKNFILYPSTYVYDRQYAAYATRWVNGEYDGSIMMRVYL
jgi:hypothetical protein